MGVINNPITSIFSGSGDGGGGGFMKGLSSGEGASPLSALSGGSGGGSMATLLDPIGAAGNAIFGDSPIKYLLMPHLLLTEGLSGGSGSSSGIATLLGGSDASSSA